MSINLSPPTGGIPTAYARIHPGSVVAAVAGGFSGLSFLDLGFAVLSVPALVAGLWAGADIARYEQRGRNLARGGVIGAIALPLLAGALEAMLFRLEAPAGFARVDFPSEVRSRSAGETPPLDRLVGHPICLKGYAVVYWPPRPSSEFTISPDGDDRNMKWHVIVELAHGEAEWTPAPIAVSGTLRILPPTADGPRYRLVDATVRPARTEYQKTSRRNRGC